PPEQARGDIDLIGPHSDVYSIGVVLYEFLCGSRPFRAANVRELLDKVVAEEIVEPRSRSNTRFPISEALNKLIMRCLVKDPQNRFSNGKELASALEEFIEGSKDKLRRQNEASKLTARALKVGSQYEKQAEAARDLEVSIQQQRSALAPWSSASLCKEVWEQEDQHRAVRRLRDDSFDEAVTLYQTALDNEPDNHSAKEGLASLYMRKMLDAERRDEGGVARFLRSQVLRYDTGRFRQELQGALLLDIRSDRSSSQVTIQRLNDSQERVRRPGEPVPLGMTPLESVSLKPGSWLLTVSSPDGLEVKLPINSNRSGDMLVEPSFDRAGRVSEGFVYISAGAFLFGGDARAVDAPERRRVELGDYAIARHPVTQQEFKRFLDEVGSEAQFTCWAGPEEVPEGERPFLPALGITRPAALAYAAWLGARTGKHFRLPTHEEWEKAARGVDGRIFPWGDEWQPTYCNNPDAFAHQPRPRPVGACPQDCSVYGIFDLAGGVCEWIAGDVPHRPDRGWVRGGSWNSHPQEARISSRSTMLQTSRGGTLGFRLVQDLI
ncbi:MAG: SUMF1/EgtB/PvdO family nonheme iron enzyme, partial [Myxococcota bacterium]|nr:SUMF1/EgtB/PvdO family nonheme iron enzyme [Myxococcota bacterium]